MGVVIALLLAVFSFIAIKAGKKGIGIAAGFVAFLVFIGWLKSGPGFNILDFFEHPSVNVPDNIPLPGGK